MFWGGGGRGSGLLDVCGLKNGKPSVRFTSLRQPDSAASSCKSAKVQAVVGALNKDNATDIIAEAVDETGGVE